MNFNPKAPQVYKPASQKVAGPPVYRPQQSNNPSAQLKSATSFGLETRPAPPVYRPQHQGVSVSQQKTQPSPAQLTSISQLSLHVRIPVRTASVHSTSTGVHPVATPGPAFRKFPAVQMARFREKFSVVQCAAANLHNLGCYRPGLLNEVETAFTKQGYSGKKIRKAILKGLEDWGDVIPGHCSKKGGQTQGEQPNTGPKCNEAKDHLITWAATHPAPVTAGPKNRSQGTTNTETETTTNTGPTCARWHVAHKKDRTSKEKCPTCGRAGYQEPGEPLETKQ